MFSPRSLLRGPDRSKVAPKPAEAVSKATHNSQAAPPCLNVRTPIHFIANRKERPVIAHSKSFQTVCRNFATTRAKTRQDAHLARCARSDTGQSARVANFLLAWWNGDDWGHFPIADLFGVDRDIAADMATIFAFLGQHPGAIYADAFGYPDAMADLVELWRTT